jgi:hypothetical protein
VQHSGTRGEIAMDHGGELDEHGMDEVRFFADEARWDE